MKKETAIYVGNMDGFAELCKVGAQEAWNVVGIFSDDSPTDAAETNRLGMVDDAVAYLTEQPRRVGCVLCALDASTVCVVEQLGHCCLEQGVKFCALPLYLHQLRRRMNVTYVGHIPLLVPRREPLRFWLNRALKRGGDIFVTLFLLATFFPLLYLVVAIRRKRRSPGPAIVLEPYCGLDGRNFLAYRFRRPSSDLVTCADEIGSAASLVEETGSTASIVEEWPRLFNVLSGTMSLVGPRPHTPEEVESYAVLTGACGPRYWAKPGLMEWTSVSDDLPQTRIDNTLWYQENWSPWLDLRIILRHVFGGGRNRAM